MLCTGLGEALGRASGFRIFVEGDDLLTPGLYELDRAADNTPCEGDIIRRAQASSPSFALGADENGDLNQVQKMMYSLPMTQRLMGQLLWTIASPGSMAPPKPMSVGNAPPK